MRRIFSPQSSYVSGYAGITLVLILISLISLVGLSVTWLGLGNAQSAWSQTLSAQTQSLVESCAESALLTYNETNTLPSSLTLPSGVCTITQNSLVGNTLTFTVNGANSDYTRTLVVVATRSTTVAVDDWQITN